MLLPELSLLLDKSSRYDMCREERSCSLRADRREKGIDDATCDGCGENASADHGARAAASTAAEILMVPASTRHLLLTE